MFGLLLELLRRFPEILVEEEKARLELGFSEMQHGIDQGAFGVDVEVRDAREGAWFLPAGKLVAGRNEAQLVTVLMQSGSRQAFNQRLAVVSLGAFAHDQQVTRGPVSICKRLASDDFDGIRLQPVPCRGMTTCDVRRGKLDNRRRKFRRPSTQLAHDEVS